MNSKRCFSLLAFVCALPLSIMAQHQVDTNAFAQNTVFFSIGGNGVLYSLNYDRSWRTGGSKMSASLGFTYLPDAGTVQHGAYSLSIPAQWNWYHGEKNHVEHGLGLSYLSGWNSSSEDYTDVVIRSQTLDLFIKPVGYRYQRPQGGFFFRFNILLKISLVELNPAWTEHIKDDASPPPQTLPWLGIDLGYSFRPKRSQSEAIDPAR